MKSLFRLARDSRGASIIEFALVLPAMVLSIYGIFIVGQLFEANAGMQHALGEGARYATLCLSPSPSMGCGVASDSAIQARMNATVFGSGMGSFRVNTPVTGSGYKTLSVTYTMPMNFLFFTLPNVSLTQTKKVYTA